MHMMATSSDLISESWLTPTQLHHQALPEDIWSKFDIEHDRALALANPEVLADHTLNFTASEMNFIANCTTTSSGSSSSGHSISSHYPMGVPPTPPHSPPTEHDLDDLVASIPEILESPSATPPSDISDILSDLESTPMHDSSMEVSWGPSWWPAIPAPAPEESLKRDIMWGGGTCCSSLFEIPKKERQVSECSADAALRDALRTDEISEDEDSEDNMPDTPSGTDSDCDVEDHMSETCTSSSSSPRSTNSATRYGNIFVFRGLVGVNSTPNYVPSVNSEHNYCGRVPEPEAHAMPGIITPSDTEDEVDVVSCNDQTDVIGSNAFNFNTACPTMLTATSSSNATTSSSNTTTTTTTSSSSNTTTRTQDQSKISADVKRQLQARIHAMRNRQNRAGATTAAPTTTNTTITTFSPEMDEAHATAATTTTTTNRFVSVKIKTQGKPAAYTKRMRDYHSEVMKTTKHRRKNRGESDEGRRNVHNSLERQRRVDLRNAFECLRLLVPETKDLEKAPKVQILKKAALHCKQLQITEQRLLREQEKLRKNAEYLQQRIAQCS